MPWRFSWSVMRSVFLKQRREEVLPASPTEIGHRRFDVRCWRKSGAHRMSCVEWGDRSNPNVLICVHGLTRNARDFDALAQALAGDYRVVCPDVLGRGQSDWLPPGFCLNYTIPDYVMDMHWLLRHLRARKVDWVGTSMGGLIGMGLAAQAISPIRRLVLNDVGPVIAAPALARIGDYVGQEPLFENFEQAETHVRRVSAAFGVLSDAQWRHLTEHSIKQVEGGWRMRYDPAIAQGFKALPAGADVDIWAVYEALRCPTLLLRGKDSDLLTPETAMAMCQRGPRAEFHEFAEMGHAPSLMQAEQIAVVRAFLLGEKAG